MDGTAGAGARQWWPSPPDVPPSPQRAAPPAVLPAPGLARGWWLAVLALAMLAGLALAMGVLAARRRRKETRFG